MTAAHAPEQELQLAPLKHYQRLTRVVWSGALSFAASGFVYGLYFLLFEAVYVYFGTTYTLSNMWNNWPTLVNLPQTLAFVHVGGEGGLGTWFVSQWPDIQKIFLQGWPIGILAGAFVSLALNRGAGKKIDWFDKATLKMHDVFGVIPSRLQSEPTSGAQYLFMLPLAMLFAIPGAILWFTFDLGGIALMHHWGYSGIVTQFFSATIVQIIGGGFFSHQFFANKITMRPAADFEAFFEDRALGKAQGAITALRGYASGRLELMEAVDEATEAGRRVKVPWWYPPNYVRILNAKLTLLAAGTLEFKERTGAARIIMIITVIIGALIAIIGLYTKFWMTNHGGLYL